FTPDVNAQVSSVTLRARKVGIPTVANVILYNLSNVATTSLDDAIPMAQGFINLNAIGTTGVRDVTANFSPNPTVLDSGRYGVLIAVVGSSAANHACFIADFDVEYDAGNAAQSIDGGVSWLDIPDATTVTFD